MIDRKIAQQQLERLRGLNWFPRDNPAAEMDLRSALEAAYTDTIAVVVVNEWIAAEQDAPKPADLRRLIWEENSRVDRVREELESDEQREQQNGRCPACQGFGFHGGFLPPRKNAGPWILCTCEAGQTRLATERVEQGSIAREKLIAHYPIGGLKKVQNLMRHAADGYHGDF